MLNKYLNEILNLPRIYLKSESVTYGERKVPLKYEKDIIAIQEGIVLLYNINGPDIISIDSEVIKTFVGFVYYSVGDPRDKIFVEDSTLVSYYPTIDTDGYISIWIISELAEQVIIESEPEFGTLVQLLNEKFVIKSDEKVKKNNDKEKKNNKENRKKW